VTHFEFTGMSTTPTVLCRDIGDLRETRASMPNPSVGVSRDQPIGYSYTAVSLFTRDDIPAALRSYVPPGARLTYPPQGMTSEVAVVEGDTPCVIKRCRDPRYLEWLSREHQVLLTLADSSIPIPRVLGYAQVDKKKEGREGWLVMSRLEGHPLGSEILHASPRRKAYLQQRLGALLKQLHATPVPIGLRSESPWVDRMLAEARENLVWCDGTAELLADLCHCRPEPVPEVLIHGDLALDNVLVGSQDAMSLIDWSGGAQGDPRYDLALALDTEPEVELGEIELAAFFEGYGGVPMERATRRWFEDLYEFF
jgi:aminoglycoside phosphotransferase (APT) family kinase protein